VICLKIKRRIFAIINKAEAGDRASQAFDVAIIVLILLSVASIVLQSFRQLAIRYWRVFAVFEIFTVAVFTVEYALRIWTADLLYPQAKHPRLKYVFSFMALVDLMAITPFYLPFIAADLRFLRLLRLLRLSRLLRLFKLGRYVDSLQVIGTVIRDAASQLIASIGACFLIVLISAILMYGVENTAQPEGFPNIAEALWWAVCTLTTVGYGDVYPITAMGKFLAAIISLVGIGIVAIPTGIISAGFTEAMAARRKANQRATAPPEAEAGKRFCPYCGHRLEQSEPTSCGSAHR
jgi:voltage-gated potassium channel